MLAHIPASKISREMVKRFAIRRFGLIIRRSACSLNGKAALYEGGCWTCSSQVKRQAEVSLGNDGIAQLPPIAFSIFAESDCWTEQCPIAGLWPARRWHSSAGRAQDR
jgi:hypothetical protein